MKSFPKQRYKNQTVSYTVNTVMIQSFLLEEIALDLDNRFRVEIFEREELFLNQVLHIIRFDEESVTIMTASGKLMIEGNGLVIESLNREAKTALIRGCINSLFFSKKMQRETKQLGGKRS